MEKTLNIDGMSCMHCVGRVKKYLETVATDVHVDLEAKAARFTPAEGFDMAEAIRTINGFGFRATEN